MGLTSRSATAPSLEFSTKARKRHPEDKVIALAGNPNVGKSTVFNALTGMNQHTGNWPGKTVTTACGSCTTANNSYVLVDLPGTYSLMAHSAEEEVARNFICFHNPDAVIVVCDATCLERNLNLVLQTLEISSRVIVCVNLMDEAKRKHIHIDLNRLAELIGAPVVGCIAQKKNTLQHLVHMLDGISYSKTDSPTYSVTYGDEIETALLHLEPVVQKILLEHSQSPHEYIKHSRWLCLRLLENDTTLMQELIAYLGFDLTEIPEMKSALNEIHYTLYSQAITVPKRKDIIVSSLIRRAEEICRETVTVERRNYNAADRRLDQILTSRLTGFPVMLLLLALVFWLTITGANYLSQFLSSGLFWFQDCLTDLFHLCHAPQWLHGVCVEGIYRVLAWVVSVMLPPMAIFFPLFTLLEDAGYLPRVAYNLDRPFQCCQACGKQALTMCMGFGCNAVGIVGCRIIDSPRERLLAILTNNFVPCNGRFPTLIAILTMFFIGSSNGSIPSLLSAALLTVLILFGVLVTFGTTKLLSKTLLKGIPSSFTLELPPYRKPQFKKVIVRSLFDRTLFVLARAAVVAAPAGLILWLMANICIGDTSLLSHCAILLEPFARLMGLDGVILIAFILGFPANEIVIPIILMAYMAQGSILELDSLVQMKQLFIDNGWTMTTAICTMLFCLMHWPCSTTLLTIKKETGSLKWTALAALIPTLIGIVFCMLAAAITRWIL